LAFEKLRLQKEIEEINAKRKSIAAKVRHLYYFFGACLFSIREIFTS